MADLAYIKARRKQLRELVKQLKIKWRDNVRKINELKNEVLANRTAIKAAKEELSTLNKQAKEFKNAA